MAGPAQPPLPIDPLLPELVAAVRAKGALVLEAPPGAGKTTRVPRALLEAKVAGDGEILVLEPRRLATRLSAQRVADELGERLGERVGYQVRFEDVSGPKTRLRFLTEGILGRRLLSDPTLKNVAAVVLDEFHERHLAEDVALAQLRQLQGGARPDLKLVVMSATLEAAPVAAYLGDCPVVRSEGRMFPVEVEHLPQPDERHLDQQVLSALKRLVQGGLDGHVLVFLPGAAEIRRAREACADFASRHGLEVHALHGDLAPAEQDRAVRRSKEGVRKLILSTNVAETSVTIEGVAAVIDSGLARVASHSPWTGLPALKLAKVSRASATQRAGRAGRTRAGVCVRLYTKHDFDGRPEHDAPEIARADLSETVLGLRASGVRDVQRFPFFEPPPAKALAAAEDLLRRLQAVEEDGGLSEVGRRLLAFPVHPRLGRLLAEGEARGVPEDAAVLAAMLGERDLRQEARAQFGRDGRGAVDVLAGPSDLLEMLERFRRAEAGGFGSGRLAGLSLDAGATQAVDRVRKQLSRAQSRRSSAKPVDEPAREQALGLCVLAGFPDRVARRRAPRSPEVLLFGGGQATLAETSVVREATLMVAVDAEERKGPRGMGVVVRIASAIEPEWLLEVAPDALGESDALRFDEATGRVERVRRMTYGDLVLEESRQVAPPSAEVGQVLAAAALAEGVEKFVDPEAWESLLAKLELLAQHFPDAGFGAPDRAFLERAIGEACADARSFKELRERDLVAAVEASLSPEQARLFRTQTPDKVALPGNRQVKVRYERGKPPWVESRLQDFFGMAQGPSVLSGRVMLVLHLLAPNFRAVQVTTDLAGFWERHYPALRKELCRRYPKHSWPEDPASARTPAELGRKR